MEKSPDYIDELIGKQLAGEAQPEEIAIIESWAKENDDNRKYVDHFRIIFQKAAEVTSFQTFDTDAAWDRLRRSLQKDQTKTTNIQGGPISRQLAWRIAASIAVVISVGLFAYRMLTKETAPSVVVLAEKEVVSDTLPDGSDVTLNKETALAYSFDKKEKIHHVRLQGEAYFNVNHEENKTFIIDMAGVYVRDIGTSFNVKAYPEANTIEVVVEKGEVLFYTDKDSGVNLRENGKGIYNKTTKTFTIDQPEANVLAYKTRIFSFSDTDLVTVVDALNAVYDKRIFLGEGLKKCHLTVSFNNESQDEIVMVIAETLGLTIKESEGNIALEGPGCE
ncbi:MAG: FecR domain-containing protein [Cyclobacteriaceae bacterium]|nr:FecR domain-containing protein [Cyclobacteriaceae bacterium]MDH4294919.1 FecR domain-containing protein [Cyclobacteriaceae bacterium]